MDIATDRDTEALLNAGSKIRTYKLLQAKGYERLAKKAQDGRTRRLLLEISASEAEDSQYWADKTRQLGEKRDRPAHAFLTNRRVNLMTSILGTRGFFEWAIIAEDESVEGLAILAGNLADSATSERWTRMASDERLYIERIKREVLAMEGWEMGGGSGVRDVIFGANDGLVSILALVAGVYGAITDSRTILIAGMAGAVAGAYLWGLVPTSRPSQRKR